MPGCNLCMHNHACMCMVHGIYGACICAFMLRVHATCTCACTIYIAGYVHVHVHTCWVAACARCTYMCILMYVWLHVLHAHKLLGLYAGDLAQAAVLLAMSKKAQLKPADDKGRSMVPSWDQSILGSIRGLTDAPSRPAQPSPSRSPRPQHSHCSLPG